MKYILVLFAIMSFGCAGPMPKLPADQSFIELPLANNLGIVSSARVGNSVVAKGKIFERPAKLLSGEIVDKQFLTGTNIFGKGLYQAIYKLKDFTFYGPAKGTVVTPATDAFVEMHGIVTHTDGRYWGGRVVSGAVAFTHYDRTFSAEQVALISDAKSFDFELPSFKQELVYNGRTGSTIRFMYREYKDDLARPAFTQNLVYDLKQSNNVVFQSVELEVLEATNTEIRYKLISGFPDFE